MPYEPGGNAGELLALLECSGPLTRSDLFRLSGLPRTTVTGMVGDLISRKLIAERTTGQADRTTQAPAAADAGVGRAADRHGRALVRTVRPRGRPGDLPGQIIARLSSTEVVGYQAADLSSIAAPLGDWSRSCSSGPGARATSSAAP